MTRTKCANFRAALYDDSRLPVPGNVSQRSP